MADMRLNLTARDDASSVLLRAAAGAHAASAALQRATDELAATARDVPGTSGPDRDEPTPDPSS